MDRAQQLSQKVEKEVRALIGDLQMQVVVLKSMLEMQSGEPQRGEPRPNDKPNDPANPHPSPDYPPVPPTRSPSPDPGEQKEPGPQPPQPEHVATVSRAHGKANGQLNR